MVSRFCFIYILFIFQSFLVFSAAASSGADSASTNKKRRADPIENRVELEKENKLIKISDRLYKFLSPHDYTLGLERIDSYEGLETDAPSSKRIRRDESRYEFWADFADVSREGGPASLAREYEELSKNLLAESESPEKLPIIRALAQDREDLLQGYDGFEISLTYNFDSELWVAFVYEGDFNSDAELKSESIEMFVSVMTHPMAPMVTHMGISRNFQHLIRVARREAKLHRRLSMKLHSFAAYFMKKRFPHLEYMITAPLPQMRGIMERNLPKGSFFVGESAPSPLCQEIHEIENGIRRVLKIYDRKREKILLEAEIENTTIDSISYRCLKKLNLKGTEAKVDRDSFSWFLKHEAMPVNKYYPYTLIFMEALAAGEF